MTSPQDGFRHEAVFHAGTRDFVKAAAPAVRAACGRDEAVLVMVDRAKIARLRADLGGLADAVHFADMESVGGNPARIIPAWQAFLDDPARRGRRVSAIGAPVWPGRPLRERDECRRYEALVNVAFAAARSFHLACAYDTDGLDAGEIAGIRSTHPVVRHGDETWATSARERLDPAEVLAEPLPAEPRDVEALPFDDASLVAVRRFVHHHAASALHEVALGDLVLAVDELAANTLRHGGGKGTLHLWHDDTHVVCQVNDRGRIDDPLVGSLRPRATQTDGRGLWMVNQLCDLVQLRSGPAGTVVRAHKRRT